MTPLADSEEAAYFTTAMGGLEMETDSQEPARPGRTFDSAYTFSFAIGIGLILFIAGLVISLTLGEGTSISLIFGIPLLIAGLVLPLIMMRDMFMQNEVKGACPYCSTQIKTSDATIRLRCSSCGKEVVVRDMKLLAVEEVTLSANHSHPLVQ